MAATSVCNIGNFTVGNFRAVVFSCTVGANTTMGVDTGLESVHFLLPHLQSCTTCGNIAITARQGAAGTSLAGYFAITGCTDGDDIQVVVFGK